MKLSPIFGLVLVGLLVGLLVGCGYKANLILPGEPPQTTHKQDDEKVKKNIKKDDTSR